jgi:tRNA nucleotidyltransferase (CCA-adding enzyme)
MTKLPTEKKGLRRWIGRLGWDTLDALLTLQEADMGSKGTGKPAEMVQFPEIRELLEEIRQEDACLSLRDLKVNGHDLMALGITGKAIGQTLNHLLEQVLDEALPNSKDALLTYLQNQEESK